MQILIADDDPTYLSLLESLLVPWGCDVVKVNDGNEAWAALDRGLRPDVVIADWLMPGLDGFDLCRKVRSDQRTRDVYVILITGSHQREDIIRVLVAGADDYLIKPFIALDLEIRFRAARRILELRKEVAQLRELAGVGV